MDSQVSARVGRVILGQLHKGEDLLYGIKELCREHDVRTGYIPSITGALERASLQSFREAGDAEGLIEIQEIEGPVECAGSGMIGQVDAPDIQGTPFGVGGYEHGEPYVHVHLTVMSGGVVVCGHLLPGCPVFSLHATSHFTIVVVEILGAALNLRAEAIDGVVPLGAVFHSLTPTAGDD